MTDTEYKLGEHRALTPFHLYFTDLSGRVSLANVAFSYRRPTNKPHSFRSCALRIRYRGTHATQKWDISFAAHRSAESRRLKRWQTLSLYAALIYATVYEMNVLNPWWWRPRGQLINRVHARVYIEHKTETMSIVYVQQLLITVTINTQVYGDVGFDIIRTSTSGFSLVLKVLLMDESSVCVHRAECLSVCACVSI